MASQQHVLSDLCNVCNKSTPKYRCPGCSARTCSLPCYKLHQQRAVCDGKRDPTKYVKKNQLETAAGIDHDYNFLAGIERDLDDAEKGLEDRGVGTRDGKRMNLKNFDGFQKRLHETQVTVQKAPVGMSRQKANKSRWNQRTKGILWTIEWIHDDHTKDLRDIHDTRPLSAAYEEHFPRRRVLKRKRGSDGAPQPLRLSAPATADDRSVAAVTAPTEQAPAEQPAGQPVEEDVPTTTTAQPSDLTGGEIAAREEGGVEGSGGQSSATAFDSGSGSPRQTQTPRQPIVEPSTTAAASTRQGEAAQAAPDQSWNFYLLRPHTYGKLRVLIPLPPDSTLLTALRQRVVLEFPTVVVLAQTPGSLPEGYVTEAAYERLLSSERAKVDGELAEEGLSGVDFDEAAPGEEVAATTDAVDGSALMEVLQKDFTV